MSRWAQDQHWGWQERELIARQYVLQCTIAEILEASRQKTRHVALTVALLQTGSFDEDFDALAWITECGIVEVGFLDMFRCRVNVVVENDLSKYQVLDMQHYTP